MDLVEEVRANAAAIAAGARSVRIDHDALEALAPEAPEASPGLDPERHYLDGTPEDVATYLLTLDAINFGSGWFGGLRKRADRDGRPVSGYTTIAWSLADRFRTHGPYDNAQMRAMRADELAAVLGQRADHELMSLYAQALRQLGDFLGHRSALELARQANGSAVAYATALAGGMAMFADRGFYKRAQIAANDLALTGLAAFSDLDRLTIFADNLVPHVLRCAGVLVYADGLAAHIDAGRPLRPGPQEREIRGCAVHACELLSQRTGIAPPILDVWLWNRGQSPEIKAIPRHRCPSVFY